MPLFRILLFHQSTEIYLCLAEIFCWAPNFWETFSNFIIIWQEESSFLKIVGYLYSSSIWQKRLLDYFASSKSLPRKDFYSRKHFPREGSTSIKFFYGKSESLGGHIAGLGPRPSNLLILRSPVTATTSSRFGCRWDNDCLLTFFHLIILYVLRPMHV